MRRACVIGHPVAHSRSPLIHGHWLTHYEIEGEYGRLDVPPDAIGKFLTEFPASGLAGVNVTLPHKEAAFRALAHAEPVAVALQAANTLWIEGGRLYGTNTDVHGFLAHLDATLPHWNDHTRTAIVLGAGGAARAIVYALLQRNLSRVTIVNRSAPRAQTLAAQFGSRVGAAGFSELPRRLGDAELLVNATSLGMTGQPGLDLDLAPMKAGAAVYDIVYAPLETPLLAAARRRDLSTVDGLGMLLHQAVPGFERWFGVRPAVTPELRALVAADLAGGDGR